MFTVGVRCGSQTSLTPRVYPKILPKYHTLITLSVVVIGDGQAFNQESPLKLKAAWTGKSSIIFIKVLKSPKIPWVSQNKLKVTWGPWVCNAENPWLPSPAHHWGHDSSVGKTSMLLLWFQCLMTCRWRLLGGVSMCPLVETELGKVNYEVENRLPTGSIAESHTVSLFSMLPYLFVFQRWGMFLPWDGARSFLHVLGGIPRGTWSEKFTDVRQVWNKCRNWLSLAWRCCRLWGVSDGCNLAPIREVFYKTRYIQNRMSFWFRISANMD